MAKNKKLKKCSSSRRILWYAFGAAGLGARALAALALMAIAIKMHPIKSQSDLFNACVEEVRANGQSSSGAVRFCNGGN